VLTAGSKRRKPKFPEDSQNRSPSTGRKAVVDGALDDGVDIAVLDRNDAAEPPRIPRDVLYDPLLASRGRGSKKECRVAIDEHLAPPTRERCHVKDARTCTVNFYLRSSHRNLIDVSNTTFQREPEF
jgi:hypothetical protein